MWPVFIMTCFITPIVCKEFVDLTHDVDNGYTIHWPTLRPFNLTIIHRGTDEKGNYYEINEFSQTEHCGTHTDAPAHFHEERKRIGEIPLDDLIGPGVVVDIEERASQDRDTQLLISDIKDWETKNGQIPDRAVVIMRSGNWKNYGNRTAYFGWPAGTEETNPSDTKNIHFPGFHPDALTWLIENRNIIGAAVDTPSIDYARSAKYESHQVLGKHNKWGLENIANIGNLPPRGFTVYNMVYKLMEGSGAPTRVFAIIGDDVKSAAHTASVSVSAMLLAAALTCFFANVNLQQ